MARKLLRALTFTQTTGSVFSAYVFKFMYEFWGYCVQGGASPTAPGAGAFPSGFSTMPVNFLEGTSLLPPVRMG